MDVQALQESSRIKILEAIGALDASLLRDVLARVPVLKIFACQNFCTSYAANVFRDEHHFPRLLAVLDVLLLSDGDASWENRYCSAVSSTHLGQEREVLLLVTYHLLRKKNFMEGWGMFVYFCLRRMQGDIKWYDTESIQSICNAVQVHHDDHGIMHANSWWARAYGIAASLNGNAGVTPVPHSAYVRSGPQFFLSADVADKQVCVVEDWPNRRCAQNMTGLDSNDLGMLFEFVALFLIRPDHMLHCLREQNLWKYLADLIVTVRSSNSSAFNSLVPLDTTLSLLHGQIVRVSGEKHTVSDMTKTLTLNQESLNSGPSSLVDKETVSELLDARLSRLLCKFPRPPISEVPCVTRLRMITKTVTDLLLSQRDEVRAWALSQLIRMPTTSVRTAFQLTLQGGGVCLHAILSLLRKGPFQSKAQMKALDAMIIGALSSRDVLRVVLLNSSLGARAAASDQAFHLNEFMEALGVVGTRNSDAPTAFWEAFACILSSLQSRYVWEVLHRDIGRSNGLSSLHGEVLKAMTQLRDWIRRTIVKENDSGIELRVCPCGTIVQCGLDTQRNMISYPTPCNCETPMWKSFAMPSADDWFLWTALCKGSQRIICSEIRNRQRETPSIWVFLRHGTSGAEAELFTAVAYSLLHASLIWEAHLQGPYDCENIPDEVAFFIERLLTVADEKLHKTLLSELANCVARAAGLCESSAKEALGVPKESLQERLRMVTNWLWRACTRRYNEGGHSVIGSVRELKGAENILRVLFPSLRDLELHWAEVIALVETASEVYRHATGMRAPGRDGLLYVRLCLGYLSVARGSVMVEDRASDLERRVLRCFEVP